MRTPSPRSLGARPILPASRRGSCAAGAAFDALEPRALLAADLAASLTYTPGTYYPGQSLANAMLNELNVGADPADGFATRVVLSRDAVYGGDDDLEILRTTRQDSPLAPGQLDRAARAITFLASVPAARYHVIVKIDADAQVAESVEGNNVWVSNTADVVIARPVVSVAAPDRTASEAGRNTGRFRITRTGPTDAPLTVTYTLGGTAAAEGDNADFDALSGTAVIPAGQSGVNIVVRPIDDARAEGPERVVLTLAEAAGYTLATAASARVDISDNDGARVRVTATDAAAAEAEQGTATFIVARSGPTGDELTVRYTLGGVARNGQDYDELSGEVTIAAGASSAAITLTPIDDAVGEPTESVLLTLSPSSSYLIVSSRRSARASIADNEPVVKIAATDGSATETGAGTGTFTVTRTGATAAALTVLYAIGGTAAGGDDFVPLSGSVTIPAGQLTASITLTPIDDAVAEGVENVVLTLSAADGYRIDTSRRRATANIADNEPIVSLTASDATATENNATTAAFTVTRSGTPGGELVVAYTVSGTAASGTDFAPLSGTVTIPAGQASATVVLTPIDDALGEGSETVVLTLAPRPAYNRNAARTVARATIADNEPSVSIAATDAAAAEIAPADDAEPNTGTFTITRTGPTVGSLTIPYTISGSATAGGDYQALEGTVTIPDGESRATITLTPIDDTLAESGETVTLTLGGNNGYLLSTSRKTATVTIADNEPVVSIVATDALAGESDGGAAVFTVSRAAAGPDEVVVHLTLSGTAASGSDFQAIASTVTIPAGAASATITLTPVQDALGEGDETVTVTIGPDPGYTRLTTGGRDRATATIRDDEPVVSLAVTDNTATEQDQTDAVLTLTRTGSTDLLQMELTVTYRVEGAADSGDDFEALDGQVTFPAGESRVTIVITAIDDGDGEPAETVIVTLEAEDDAPYSVDAARAAGTITITDNEPAVSIVATDAAAAENNNPGVFTIRRTGSTAEDLVVSYTVAGTAIAGTDYAALTGSVTIPAESSSVTVTIQPFYDLATEPAESVRLTLAAGPGYRIDNAREAVVNIANAQAVDLSLLSVSYPGRSYSLSSTGAGSPIVLSIGNLGDAASAAFTAEYRLSTNTTWGDDDDVVIGASSVAALAGGAASVVTFDFGFDAVKSRVAAGSYYLAVRLDPAFRVLEAGEVNNTFFSSSPDIVVTE